MERKNIKILAVNDYQDNLITIKALVHEAFPDLVVLTATSGKDGITMARAEDPDMIFLDIVLPDMDGFSVCLELKNDIVLRNIPVVFVTALKGDKENRIRALEAGAEGFLNKPIDESELAVQIRAMAKIRDAYLRERDEKIRLEALVVERTRELRKELEERKKVEMQIVENTERLESLIGILQHDSKNVQEFLDHTLIEAIKLTESKIGYINFYSEEKKEFSFNTWSNGVMKECTIVDPNAVYKLETTGFWGEAVRQRKSIIVNDFEADSPFKKGCPSGHVRLKKFLTVPVFQEKKIVAVIGVANKVSDYDHSDMLQLTLLMDAVWKITSRKSIEDALQVSEDRYRRIIEGITDYLYTVRIKNGRAVETFHSTACVEVTGYSAEEFLSDPYLWITMIPAEERESVRIRVEEILAGKQIVPIEHHIRRKDGELRWVSDTAVLQKDIHGNLLSYEGVVKDITDRKKAELQLELSANIVQNIQVGLYIYKLEDWNDDRSLRMVFANPASVEFTGVRVGDVVGKTLDENFPGMRIKGLPQKIANVVRTKQAIVIEDVYYSDERVSEAAFSIKAFPLPDNQVGTSFENVTKRKWAEQALKESESFVRAIMDNLPIGIAVNSVDPAVQTIYMNDNFCKFYRISREALPDADAFWGAVYEDPEFREKIQKRVLDDCSSGDPERMMWADVPIARKGYETTFVTAMNKLISKNKLVISTVWDVTASKRVEEALRESEKKYSSLFASMAEAVSLHEIICDISGKPVDYRFLDINPAFERLTGLKKTDIIGKTVLTVLPATEPVWIEKYGKVALTGEPTTFENFSSEFNKYYHIVAFSPQKNQFAVIFSDITERKNAEAALRESEEKQSAMISNISDVICIIGVDGNVKYMSPNIEKWFGWVPQDVAGKPGWLTIHPDDLERVQNAFGTLLEKDNSVATIEYRYKCKDGSYKQVQLTATNLTKDPVICGVLLNYHDITRRKDAEDNLRASEERFRTMFQQAPLGIALIDSTSGLIFEVNSRFEEIAGRSRDEMISVDWMRLTHPDDIQEDLENMARMNEQIIQGFTNKKRYIRPDGSYVWINMTIAPVIVENKYKPSLLCMIQDITEMRAIESRLRQSEKMEAIGQLAGGIAHDFNNVLGGIIGYTDLSIDLVEKGSVMENNLQKILKASERAKLLVQQILTFSRRGNQQKSVIAVPPIVKEVLELLRATIPSSVIIESDLHKGTKPIFGDPTKIHEMLLNLATNGVYAMDRKGTLRVQLYPLIIDNEIYSRTGKIAPGEYAVIEVTDTGHGMDAAVLQKAFDPFFTTKPVGEGTGMGLSVVLGVIQLHGGDVQVDSEPGKGTTFKIYLPVTAQELAPDCIGDDTSDFQGGKESVLFVDDEQLLVDIAVDILSSLGYNVTGFSDSLQALKFVGDNANKIDILVTDQTMPGMTGVELAKAALKIRKDLPVILCTGYSVEINPERAAAIGISRIAMKPLRLRQFAGILRETLDNCSKEAPLGTNSGY
jgi:PAS domain S-box-containing protein